MIKYLRLLSFGTNLHWNHSHKHFIILGVQGAGDDYDMRNGFELTIINLGFVVRWQKLSV